MRRVVIAVVLMGTVTAIAMRAWPKRSPSSSPLPEEEKPLRTDEDDDERAVRRELQAIRRELAETRRERLLQVAQNASRNIAPAQARRPTLSPQEQKERRRAFIAQVAQSFQQQRRDSIWAVQTERVMADALRGTDPNLKNVAISCATTMCKVVAESDDEDGQRRLAEDVASAEPFGNGTLYDRDGLVTTMYVKREADRPFIELAENP